MAKIELRLDKDTNIVNKKEYEDEDAYMNRHLSGMRCL